MKRLLTVILTIALICAATESKADSSDLAGSTELVREYCNPLPMEIRPGANASGDVTVICDNGMYYMFCTGGGAWISADMLNWEYHQVIHEARIPVAPDVAKFNGKFYMSGNDSPLYVADDPLGPYRLVGEWSNTGTIAEGWNGAFDTHIFVDDDNQPYLFWPGRGISGIFGVKLNPDRMNEFAGKPVHLLQFNPEHIWERYGEFNEYPGVAWIEGPWVIKRNGTYYLEYSASGTQWKTYAEGYYTAKSPLGPYRYAHNNPLLRKTDGLVTGTAHGSIVKGPDNNWWQFYTIVLSNPPGGRRIGMDRIDFDKKDNMSVIVTETPQPAPLAAVSGISEKKSDSRPAASRAVARNSRQEYGPDIATVPLPVTVNKMRAMNALSKASSEQPGFYAAYAVDNSSGTIWMPQPQDTEPSITIELSPATRFDIVQLFTVSSLRIMFGSAARPTGRQSLQIYKYKLEASVNGNEFHTILDRTGNTIPRNTTFDEFPPEECRFIRLTITGWPQETQLGIIEFTVFGYPSSSRPAAVASPTFANLPKDK